MIWVREYFGQKNGCAVFHKGIEKVANLGLGSTLITISFLFPIRFRTAQKICNVASSCRRLFQQ
jgi:hypothetical protein